MGTEAEKNQQQPTPAMKPYPNPITEAQFAAWKRRKDADTDALQPIELIRLKLACSVSAFRIFSRASPSANSIATGTNTLRSASIMRPPMAVACFDGCVCSVQRQRFSDDHSGVAVELPRVAVEEHDGDGGEEEHGGDRVLVRHGEEEHDDGHVLVRRGHEEEEHDDHDNGDGGDV
ncbi:hypothetical protein SASPL_103832 [Salvia splendens]|uniref:Uncharacterized protein n=1 Tax=Salvia splendens TaxID=180675 RepID=A0A8X9A761_SALSN|nr:hypothetical protein SASPL_103832 [Salvia splendens]